MLLGRQLKCRDAELPALVKPSLGGALEPPREPIQITLTWRPHWLAAAPAMRKLRVKPRLCKNRKDRDITTAPSGHSPCGKHEKLKKNQQVARAIKDLTALAESVRFELTDAFTSAVFKTAGLNHSPNSPEPQILSRRRRPTLRPAGTSPADRSESPARVRWATPGTGRAPGAPCVRLLPNRAGWRSSQARCVR